MKAKTLSYLLLGVISILVISCGVSQDQYDQLVAELDSEKARSSTLTSDVAELESDLAAIQEQVSSLKSELDQKTAELESVVSQNTSLEDDLSSRESELSTSTGELNAVTKQISELESNSSAAKSKAELLESIFVPSITGEIFTLTEVEAVELFLQWLTKIEEIDDPTLTAKFNAFLEESNNEQVLMDFFQYLIESIPDSLE